MNDGIKQRIVGALVLIALGIIFVPVIFDKERIVPVDRTSQIPPEPELRALPLPEAAQAPGPIDKSVRQPIQGDFEIETKKDALSSTTEVSEVKDLAKELDVIQAPEVTRSTPDKVTPAKELKLEGWVLQVASYADQKQASRTQDELVGLGYRGFIKSVQTKDGTRYRLYVGPSIEKSTLEESKSVIDAKYNVNTILLKYKP